MDITREAGITFVHASYARGEKLLPETMGSGVAFLDYDGDGDQDLLFINSAPWPGQTPEEGPKPTQALYRNDGTGHFQDVTRGSGLDVVLPAMGVAVGDYDNDGDPDIYITTLGGGHLFRNDGGKFVDVTNETNTHASDGWLTSAAFFDMDNDGDLDLFVCCYVTWSPEIDRGITTQITGDITKLAYDPPTAFKGAFNVLLRNDGGHFTDVSREAGIRVCTPDLKEPMAKSLGVAPLDIDGDGLVDLAVANDTVANFLFHNLGGGKFEEIGTSAGIAYDQLGQARGAMGIDWADFKNDGSLGLAIGNFANEMAALYVTDDPASLLFADLANLYGLARRRSRRSNSGCSSSTTTLTAARTCSSATAISKVTSPSSRPARAIPSPRNCSGIPAGRNRRGLSWSVRMPPDPTCSARSSAGAAPTPTSTATATSMSF